ncbi:Uncharacterized protein dnl_25270 [Desulfonema limicola]|uniref:Uncharacterized protein n=1 Tax=Desulfonema limicola TaxID=45656 RepID=A0A975GGE4_9BACT|nr:Uncharacterized protein dnl_25270 [Desulfonema limicola]
MSSCQSLRVNPQVIYGLILIYNSRLFIVMDINSGMPFCQERVVFFKA